MSLDLFLNTVFLSTLLAAAFRIATPILFAALGEAVAERAGILNIGIEGMMAIGAFTGFAAANWSDSLWVGFAVAALASGAIGLLFGYVTIERGADHVVTGIVLNIFCLGLASLGYKSLYSGRSMIPQVPNMHPLRLPWLSDLPFFGRALFSHLPVVWIAFALVPVFAFLLSRTEWGLNVRAVGENPTAVDTAGLNVWRLRLGAIAIGGAMAGIGGATLSIAELGAYLDNMTAGRGFIALAVVVFGGWRPWRIALACLVFGGAEAVQLRLQALGAPVPNALLLAVPYILTIVIVAAFAGKAGYPAAIAQPYLRRRRHVAAAATQSEAIVKPADAAIDRQMTSAVL